MTHPLDLQPIREQQAKLMQAVEQVKVAQTKEQRDIAMANVKQQQKQLAALIRKVR